MSSKKRSNPPRPELVLESLSTRRLRIPSLYKVYLLNNDYTPMDFGVEVLEKYFFMDKEIATQIMLQVHKLGMGVCGLYTKEIAETKVALVNEFSRRNEYPLLCKMEVISTH